MRADHDIVQVMSPSEFPRLLSGAAEAPIVFEINGVTYRLARQDPREESNAAGTPAAEHPQSKLDEMHASLKRIRERTAALERGSLGMRDSAALIRRMRLERTADQMRATGHYEAGDSLWWELARLTIEEFTTVRDAIFGDRVFDDDSTDIVRDARAHQPTVPT